MGAPVTQRRGSPMTAMYWLSRLVARLVARLYLNWERRGCEHVPRAGALLLAANHQSLIDPALIGSAVARPVSFLARRTLWGHRRLFDWWLGSCNAVPVDQERADVASLKRVLRILQQGGALVVFPEGSRTYDGTLGPARPGVGMLACRSAAAVVPVLIEGAFEVLPRGSSHLRRGMVRLSFGPPLRFGEAPPGADRAAHYLAVSEEIMARIAALSEGAPERARAGAANAA